MTRLSRKGSDQARKQKFNNIEQAKQSRPPLKKSPKLAKIETESQGNHQLLAKANSYCDQMAL